MKTQTLYMNVYRAGFYHRQGKPGHCNIHAGDFFTSYAEALRCAERDKGYVTTISFEMPVPDGATILRNPEGSVPSPLAETCRNPLMLVPWYARPDPPVLTAGTLCATPEWGESLDTSEREARPYTPPAPYPSGNARAQSAEEYTDSVQRGKRLIERHLTTGANGTSAEDLMNRAELLAYEAD